MIYDKEVLTNSNCGSSDKILPNIFVKIIQMPLLKILIQIRLEGQINFSKTKQFCINVYQGLSITKISSFIWKTTSPFKIENNNFCLLQMEDNLNKIMQPGVARGNLVIIIYPFTTQNSTLVRLLNRKYHHYFHYQHELYVRRTDCIEVNELNEVNEVNVL